MALNDRGDIPARLLDIGEQRVEEMDAAGVDLQILSIAPPGTHGLPAREAIALSRDANDRASEAVDRYPTRLRAMTTLPMSDPDAAVAELQRTANAPAHFDTTVDLALATFGWGWHIEAGLAVLRLILRGTFDRHPNLQIVLGHWGEMLLFALDRIDSLSNVATDLDRRVAEYFQTNVYIATSGMLTPVCSVTRWPSRAPTGSCSQATIPSIDSTPRLSPTSLGRSPTAKISTRSRMPTPRRSTASNRPRLDQTVRQRDSWSGHERGFRERDRSSHRCVSWPRLCDRR
ncbi:MAG: amidohydrolase family protein [Pseudonocardiaceae bacterium]